MAPSSRLALDHPAAAALDRPARWHPLPAPGALPTCCLAPYHKEALAALRAAGESGFAVPAAHAERFISTAFATHRCATERCRVTRCCSAAEGRLHPRLGGPVCAMGTSCAQRCCVCRRPMITAPVAFRRHAAALPEQLRRASASGRGDVAHASLARATTAKVPCGLASPRPQGPARRRGGGWRCCVPSLRCAVAPAGRCWQGIDRLSRLRPVAATGAVLAWPQS